MAVNFIQINFGRRKAYLVMLCSGGRISTFALSITKEAILWRFLVSLISSTGREGFDLFIENYLAASRGQGRGLMRMWKMIAMNKKRMSIPPIKKHLFTG
jgi:hypothetical protein